MPEPMLATHIAGERADAIRALLARPLLDAGRAADAFRLVVRHSGWLTEWFETSCGWRLAVDPGAGFARLAKRPAGQPDPTRPLRRRRSSSDAPFDRRRYQLLCLVCAELVRAPVTTMGLLARAVTAEAGLDTSRQAERRALVDALLVLVDWGAVSSGTSDLEAFIADRTANALLTADTTRLHQLVVSAQSPSTLTPAPAAVEAAAVLRVEPRYGVAASAPSDADEEQRLRWVRHTVARRLLDDPVVHLADLTEAEQEYLAHPSGRRWLRDRVAEAGLVLEERADGLLAVDPDATATDLTFPERTGHANQLALLLIDRLVRAGADGSRRLVELGPVELRRELDDVLRRYPAWAQGQREGEGPRLLLDRALDRLVAFGLCRRADDGTVVALPAAARYRVGEPTVTGGQESLFAAAT